MAKRSNVIVALGLAVFMLGALATFLIVRDDDDESPTPGSGRVAVLVAAKPIPAGTDGAAAVSGGFVDSKVVSESAKPAGAFVDKAQLAGQTTVLGVPEGGILTAEQFQAAQTRIGTLKIPDGKTALAVQLSNVNGVAGFAGAGDHINVLAVQKPGTGAPGGAARLIMQNVEVLNVNGTTLAASQGQPGGSGLVFLLAVTPTESERLAFITSFETLYFSLVAKGQAAVPATPGSALADVLKPLF